MNARVGTQSLENRKFQAHTYVQIQNICDSLTHLRNNLESLRSDTYISADEDQSYVEEVEEESRTSLNDKGSDDEIDNRKRAPDDEWIPGGNIPKCQNAPCLKQAFHDQTEYSIACSRYCFRVLTGNPPKNHSKPQNRSPRADPGSHHAYPRQHHRQHHHSHQPLHPSQSWDDQATNASKFGSKGADESHRGWGDSPPSSTYTALEDEISVLGGQSCGQMSSRSRAVK